MCVLFVFDSDDVIAERRFHQPARLSPCRGRTQPAEFGDRLALLKSIQGNHLSRRCPGRQNPFSPHLEVRTRLQLLQDALCFGLCRIDGLRVSTLGNLDKDVADLYLVGNMKLSTMLAVIALDVRVRDLPPEILSASTTT